MASVEEADISPLGDPVEIRDRGSLHRQKGPKKRSREVTDGRNGKEVCASKGEGRGIRDGLRCNTIVKGEGKWGLVSWKTRRGEIVMGKRENGAPTKWFGKGRRGFGRGGDSKSEERGEKKRFRFGRGRAKTMAMAMEVDVGRVAVRVKN
ncbi:hypothetical protein GOBAR_AA31811 [Gossypium barbadense]|uniref:Uncharacterized protein n=1 Tax=Gossypium barbadense TaxID=3634 RepID=A0A2P5WCS5_GOSBA|nr:hypothetical protein GOBAR_AA31811 [Gossypium barbadense]